MRKNIKNDKVLRAITIGLATMIAATSIPTNVFAEEGEGNSGGNDNETTSQSSGEEGGGSGEEGSSQEGQEASQPTVESVSAEVEQQVTNEFKDANSEITASLSDIGTADTSVAAVEGLVTTDAYIAGVINDDLDEASIYVNAAAGNIQAAQEEITDALVDQAVANFNANQSIQAVENQLGTVDTAINNVNTQMTELGTNADTANKSDNAAEAAGAKYQAEQNVKSIADEVDKAEKAAAKAAEDAQKAQKDLDAAQKAYDDAAKEVEEAKKLLNSAGGSTKGAIEKLNDAKEKAAKLKAEAEQNKKDLQKIEDQYYAMMVQYYRTALGAGNTKYDADGKLLIEENAAALKEAKAKDGTSQLDYVATHPGNESMYLGRDLLRKIVTYNIKNDENVDWENAELQFGVEGKTFQDAYEGIVFEDDSGVKKGVHGKDQVVVQKDRKDKNGDTIEHNANSGYKWDRSTTGDGGRTNRVKVTYKDKNGDTQTKYYNYIFKNSDEASDLSGGPIYVALIEEDSDGKHVNREGAGMSNFDNMTNLKDVLKAVDKLDAYDKAQNDVAEAEAEVKRLEEAIKKLNNISVDAGYLGQLKERLDAALGNLEEAQATAEALSGQLEEAQSILDSIDLSRFDTKSGESDNGEDRGSDESDRTGGGDAGGTDIGGTDATVTAGTEILSGISIPGVELSMTAPASVSSGVAGVRAARSEGQKTDDKSKTVTDSSEVKTDKKQGVAGVRVVNNKKNNQSLVKVEDPKVPLAKGPADVEDEQMNWWWLLVIALFGVVGKAMYEEHKRKANAVKDIEEDN